jgi:hypothetical protein
VTHAYNPQACPRQIVLETGSLTNPPQSRAGGVAQECLPSKHEALSSTPSTAAKKKRKIYTQILNFLVNTSAEVFRERRIWMSAKDFEKYQKVMMNRVPVAHSCNLSYLGG